MLKFTPVFFLTLLTFAGCGKPAPQTNINTPDITRWAQPDVDIAKLLSVEPNECLKPVTRAVDIQDIALGRMAFRSPFLLGGQATRKGLTCQACHTQGVRNENFFITGLSEAPGTADVSNFHFSDELGDEIFNPTPIPSLSDDIRNVDYDPKKTDFEDFVTRLITKEFTGKNPSPEIKTALLKYLRQLDNSQCSVQILTGPDLLDYKVKVIGQSFDVLAQNNFTRASQNFLAAALRIELGRLDTRFPNVEPVQSALADISQSLNTRGGDILPENITQAADKWAKLSADIPQFYDQSLFNPLTIKLWAQ
ncbi:MAG: hypothetical protein ABJG88_10365 [Litorimonas sp.]